MAAGSILFVRSVPTPLALRALRELSFNTAGVSITVLTPPSGSEMIREALPNARVTVFTGRRFGLRPAGLRLLRWLRRQRFDVVVVPFTGRDVRRFWNVGRLGLAAAGRRTVWLPCDDADRRLGIDGCPPVRWRDYLADARSWRATRLRLLAAITWPLLVAGSCLAIVALLLVAAVLLPSLWLTPGPATRHG